MPDLRFEVRGAETADTAVALHLEISNRPAEEVIETILLRCQIRIEAPRRQYTPMEQRRLHDLFGEPERWGQTLRPMQWANIAVTVPGFIGSTQVVLTVPCTFELDSGPTNYFQALEDGTAPITVLFSGTIFYQAAGGKLQAAPISWNSESRFALPVGVWKRSMEVAV